MERAGYTCVGYVEWDKFARKSYEAIHQVTDEWTRHDITKITNEEWKELDGKVDIITAGFPCQAFSIAGKRRGFQDTRGTMFFEVARAAQQIHPQFLFLENVKGLLNNAQGKSSPRLMNWGMMSNGVYVTISGLEFRKTENVPSLSRILEDAVDPKYFLSAERMQQLLRTISSE